MDKGVGVDNAMQGCTNDTRNTGLSEMTGSGVRCTTRNVKVGRSTGEHALRCETEPVQHANSINQQPILQTRTTRLTVWPRRSSPRSSSTQAVIRTMAFPSADTSRQGLGESYAAMHLTHIRRPRPCMSIWLYSIVLTEVVLLFATWGGKVRDREVGRTIDEERR